MSELFIGLWGPGVFVEAINSKPLATEGKIMLMAIAYVDCGVRIPTAFAAMKDALAA